MDEVVKLVSQKTGLSAQQATIAVETVIGYLKGKLPAPIAGQLDAALSGKGTSADVVKDVEGLLGKK